MILIPKCLKFLDLYEYVQLLTRHTSSFFDLSKQILVSEDDLSFVFWMPAKYYKMGFIRILCLYSTLYSTIHICCVFLNIIYKYYENFVFNAVNFFISTQVSRSNVIGT